MDSWELALFRQFKADGAIARQARPSSYRLESVSERDYACIQLDGREYWFVGAVTLWQTNIRRSWSPFLLERAIASMRVPA